MHNYRILLTTVGSLGDLHPILALGIALKQRGHKVRIATLDQYRDKVCNLGLEHASIRAFVDMQDKEQLAKIMDLKKGSEYLIKEVIFAHVREVYQDILAAAERVDIIGASEITYAAQIVAEQKQLPWFFCALSPISFFSSQDVSLIPIASEWPEIPYFTEALHRFLVFAGKQVSASWSHEWHRLRAELKLPLRPNPIAEGKFSPFLNLALFSKALATPQQDWPTKTEQTGYVFYDAYDNGKTTLPAELLAFLESGDAPVVFTLGSAAVHSPGAFYKESLQVVKKLGCRAVFLTGDNPPEQGLPDSVFTTDYAPFSELFKHAACVVHQGGVGTCGQALRAGVPTLIVPYSHDQPDNALRLKRSGTSLSLLRSRYTAEKATPLLRALLTEPRYSAQAKVAKKQLQREYGAIAACEHIERLLLHYL